MSAAGRFGFNCTTGSRGMFRFGFGGAPIPPPVEDARSAGLRRWPILDRQLLSHGSQEILRVEGLQGADHLLVGNRSAGALLKRPGRAMGRDRRGA